MMKQVKITMPRRVLTLVCGLILAATAFAQEVAVKGHVVDKAGEPIIGATVRLEGQEGGVVTDFDGNFSLSANSGATIRVEYIGYDPYKGTVAPQMNITLTEAGAMGLNEVVVIGYGVAKKSDLTGSVSALKPDSKNKGLVVNPQDLIAGKVAGVNVVTNDGTPGGGTTMRIRGGSSLNASNDPLIVIDGVPIDNNGVKGVSNILSTINPQDIESFNILKDASATAIYGSRGSNGVIIITTKKGRKGQPVSISYNGSMTVGMKKNIIDVMDAAQYRDFIKKSFGEASTQYSALGTADTNWQDLIYRTSISHDHNVTVAGAAGSLPYRVSVGYTDQQGIIKTSDFKRLTGSINLNPSLLDDHLVFNLNAKGMLAKSIYADGSAVGNATRMDPTQDPYSYTSVYHKALFGNNMAKTLSNFGGYFQWTASGIDGDPSWPFNFNTVGKLYNPLAILALKDDQANSREFIGSADVDYKVHGFEDLRLHATLGADVAKGTQDTNILPSSPLAGYYGSYGAESILKRNLSLSTYAQYYHDFNDAAKNHFDIMGGYEYQHFYRSQNNDYIGYYPLTNTTLDSKGKPLAGTARDHTPYKFATENYLVSFFGRANWSLMDRYYVTATVREDGSSRFEKHWSMFPSFAFAWKIKDENKFREINWLSDLKLRLGWGMTGQQDVNNDYAWIPTYSKSTGTNGFYPVTDVDLNGDGKISADEKGALYRPDNYTSKLKWETTTTYNIGFDWGILNQRLSGSVDWYYRKTEDLLNYAPTMVFSAFRNQAWQNIGSLTNTGVEVALNWKALQTKDWYWTIDYNFTYNKNHITDLSGVSSDNTPVPNTGITIGTDKYLQYNQVGYAANSFYVYQQAYDKNGKAIEGALVDRNADGQITQADRYFYKNPIAPVIMGLSSRLEYKNWDLGFALRASIGNYVYNNVEQGYHNVSLNGIWPSTNYLQNTTTKAVTDGFVTDLNYQLLSDFWIHNASFLKCDNITLGYSFSNILKTAAFKGLNGRFYATATNVFTITKYKGLDPEVFNGYDSNMYPRPFSVIVGLNLNF